MRMPSQEQAYCSLGQFVNGRRIMGQQDRRPARCDQAQRTGHIAQVVLALFDAGQLEINLAMPNGHGMIIQEGQVQIGIGAKLTLIMVAQDRVGSIATMQGFKKPSDQPDARPNVAATVNEVARNSQQVVLEVEQMGLGTFDDAVPVC